MTHAEYHQQQLERQEQITEMMYHKDVLGDDFSIHVWSEPHTVYINIRSGVTKTELMLTPAVADALADQITMALRRAK